MGHGLFKTSAVVLKKYPFGEYDEIIHMFSSDYGKIKTFARGSRKAKSELFGKFEPFYEITALFSSGKNFDIVSQAEIINCYGGILKDLESLYCGFYFLELSEQLLPYMSPEPKIYIYLKKILNHIETNTPDDIFILSALYYFLVFSGVSPSLDSCVKCGRKSEFICFDPVNGGSVCMSCRPSTCSNSQESLISFISDLPVLKLDALRKKYDDKAIFEKVRLLLESYLSFQTGVELKSASFITVR